MGFESWLERDHLMLMDFDPAVRAVSSQPFWLRWRDGGAGSAGMRRISSPAGTTGPGWWSMSVRMTGSLRGMRRRSR